jgi:uncharacterized protein YuzE
MPITAQYDPEADALYLRLADGVRDRTIEVDDVTYIDIDAAGRPLGIELLYPSMGLNLAGALGRLSLETQAPAILAAIEESGAPVPAPTYTGGARIATMMTQMIAVEGTIAATHGVTTPGVAAIGEPFVRVEA